MLNQRDRRQLHRLERQLSEEDPDLAQAFQSWQPPSSEYRSPDLSDTQPSQQDQHRTAARFAAAVSLRRWWGALFVVCGLALAVVTVVGMTLGAWAYAAITLAALGGVFGLAALWFWLTYRNAVCDRRRRRR